MVTRRPEGRPDETPWIDALELSKADPWPGSRRLILIWVLGLLVLLPLDVAKLTHNAIWVDVWSCLGLSLFWGAFVRGKQRLSVAYSLPFWVILLASLASTLAAVAPQNSVIVMVKEVYLFVWFITLSAVLAHTPARDFRRLLVAWMVVVVVHGGVIVAQFVSPSVWHLTARLAGSLKHFELYRPNGLFLNPNWAAFFQLLGLVPVVLVSPSPGVGLLLGLFVVATMLLTGSMGAGVALLGGLAAVLVALAWRGHGVVLLKTVGAFVLALCLLGAGGWVMASRDAGYQTHFAHIFHGRADRSSEGRFELWQRGLERFVAHDIWLWGLGPENFRVVDGRDKQLHSDLLAFAVERGVLGALGLVLFALVAVSRAVSLVGLQQRYPSRARPVVVVFLGAMIAIVVESLTHQSFHFRTLWLVLAFQEATLYKLRTSPWGMEPPRRPQPGSREPLPEFVGERARWRWGKS